MNIQLRELTEQDRESVIDIFNYFIENGFAAYPEEKVPYGFFDVFLEITKGYSAMVLTDKDQQDKIIGFGLMRAYHPIATFKRTAELTYFLLPEYTRKGLGQKILNFFIEEAEKRNIDSLLAGISSLNEPSINFHKKMGFQECGRFQRIGSKFGKDFDIVWMQRLL